MFHYAQMSYIIYANLFMVYIQDMKLTCKYICMIKTVIDYSAFLLSWLQKSHYFVGALFQTERIYYRMYCNATPFIC